MEDGSELSVLGCGASRDRRDLGFATLPVTIEKSQLQSNKIIGMLIN